MICARALIAVLVAGAALSLSVTASASSPLQHAASVHAHQTVQAAPSFEAGKPYSAKTLRSLQYVGFMMGIHEFYNYDQALMMMQKVRTQGVNTVRVFIRWDYKPAPVSSDLQGVANAAKAAEQVGLKALILNLTPTQTVWPLNDYDMTWFKNNIVAYDQVLFDPSSDYISHPSPLQIIWAIGNEPNIDTFCNGADKDPKTAAVGWQDQHKVCADREARLLHASYGLIRSEKAYYQSKGSLKPNDLQVIGGLLSSNDAPLDFITQWIKARQNLGFKTCDMDIFGYHPYTMPGGNLYSGFYLVPKLVAALKAMKCPLPIIFTEMGYPTRPPVDPGSDLRSTLTRMGYNELPGGNIDPGMPLSQYVGTIDEAMKITLSYPQVIGALNMLLNDERRITNGWQSGWCYWDGSPKPFLSQVQQIFQDALIPRPVTTPRTGK